MQGREVGAVRTRTAAREILGTIHAGVSETLFRMPGEREEALSPGRISKADAEPDKSLVAIELNVTRKITLFV